MHPRGTRLARPKSDRPRLVLGSPDRVALVQRIFRMYIHEGLGYHSIAVTLNAEGIPSPRDGKWSATTSRAWGVGTIRSILLNGTYTGSLYFNRGPPRRSTGSPTASPRSGLATEPTSPTGTHREDWIITEDSHPAIIDHETYRRVLARHRERDRSASSTAYRRGRAKASPYVLSGIMRCACGNAYCGQTTTKGKPKKSGEPVRTSSYMCSGYLSKGRTVCIRRPVPKVEMEALIWQRVETRLSVFLDAGGEDLLAKMIAEEMGHTGSNPAEEAKQLRARLAAVNEKASVLLDTITDATKTFVQEKLAALARERDQLEAALAECEAAPQVAQVDPRALAAELRAQVAQLEAIRAHGTVEEQKTFLRGSSTGSR